jgi:hypothetical protein
MFGGRTRKVCEHILELLNRYVDGFVMGCGDFHHVRGTLLVFCTV